MRGLHHINLGNSIQCIIYNYLYYATSCLPAPFLRLLLGWLLGLVFMHQNLTLSRDPPSQCAAILLLQPPKHWIYKHAPPHQFSLASFYHRKFLIELAFSAGNICLEMTSDNTSAMREIRRGASADERRQTSGHISCRLALTPALESLIPEQTPYERLGRY